MASDPTFSQIIYRAPGLTTSSHTPSQPLPSSQFLYWRVRARNACGIGQISPTSSFSTLAVAGECGATAQPVTLFQEDFESGASSWVSSGVQNGQALTDTWTLSDTRTHSGSAAMVAPGIESASDRYLLSPAITLPADQSGLTLHFWNYQSIERVRSNNLEVVACYDGALIELSPDQGATWLDIPPANFLTDQYDGQISGSFDNPLGGRRAWCGDPQDWLESIIDLNAYAGQRVHLRFRMGTDDGTSREGWYVDDVKVQYCTAGKKTLYLPLLTGGQ
ncbi:MAG: choice-of-anchor J domain-containing protein [Ardenticatenales bacterium]|nr:choice-of-anchor J domain-containing protein [Ardenticatenales bacterium]